MVLTDGIWWVLFSPESKQPGNAVLRPVVELRFAEVDPDTRFYQIGRGQIESGVRYPQNLSLRRCSGQALSEVEGCRSGVPARIWGYLLLYPGESVRARNKNPLTGQASGFLLEREVTMIRQ